MNKKINCWPITGLKLEILDRFKTYVASLLTVFEKVRAFRGFRFQHINETIYILLY